MSDNISAGICKRLYMLRTSKNETQFEIGDLLGITPAAYGKIENGDRALSVEYCVELAKHYGVSCDYIIRGEEAVDREMDTAKDAEISYLRKMLDNLKWAFEDYVRMDKKGMERRK